jgi:two-component system, OmpR family, sensor kinase
VSPLPIRWRLTLGFAVVMAILLTATGVFVRDRVRSDLDAALNASLRAHAADVAALAQQSDSGLADAQPVPHGGQRPQFAQIIDPHGRVLDGTTGLRRRPLINPEALAHAPSGGIIVGRTMVAHQAVQLLAEATRAQGERLIIVVGQSLEQRVAAIRDLTAVLLLGGPAALLLASLAGYGLAGAALRPVEVMRRRERRFIADASHELRTPLTMLRTELELIARDQPAGLELAQATASAIEETEHLRVLAEDLLLLSRADHGHLTLSTDAVRPAELVDAAVLRAQTPALASGVHVLGAVSEPLPPVRVDRLRMAQALGNLLDNAIRYAACTVEVTARRSPSGVEFHVLDDGPGIPPDFQRRAWERFSRADTARTDDGAGLGLSIVRTIVQLHGGGASATNRPEGGADVWINLPVSAAPPAAPDGLTVSAGR